jgi:hypothetical protein
MHEPRSSFVQSANDTWPEGTVQCRIELPIGRTVAPMLFSASSFGPLATALRLTNLFVIWRDDRRRVPTSRTHCFLEYPYSDSLTVSRMHVKVIRKVVP